MFWKRENDNWMVVTIPLPETKTPEEEKDQMLALYVAIKKAVMEETGQWREH